MKKFQFIIFSFLTIIFSHFVRAQKLCFPIGFGGIVPGISLDKDVVAMYGKGFFDNKFGHGGGRIYTDSSQGSTLIVEIGVDYYIEAVRITKGLAFPDSVLKFARNFISKHFEITDNGKLLAGLYSTKERIKTTYGDPTEQYDNGNIWVYELKIPTNLCYLESSISFSFTDNRVSEIVISNGGD